MGRRSRKKKRRVQSERQRRKGHDSGPETATGSEKRESCSPAWNSLDEESLADYAENAAAGDSGGEVEVAKLLSFLNFSVIPCALEPRNFECGPHSAAAGPPTDVDLLSELTSATHLERDGAEGETAEGRERRETRKRASRRRPNKRAKKLRSSGPTISAPAGDWTCLCRFVRAGQQQVEKKEEEEEEEEGGERAPSLAALSPRGAVSAGTEMIAGRGCERCGTRGKVRRKTKGERFDPLARRTEGRGRRGGNRSESTTPVNLPTRTMAQQLLVEMECENGDFSTDTSAVAGEVDMGAEPEDSDHTPPADPSPGDSYEGERDDDEEEEEEESDLSDTTTDSGCDGDDEESSVERVGMALPGWWEREPPFISSNEESDSDHEKLASILNGAFPCGSPAVSSKKPRSLRERLDISEFKHPGKVGVRGGRSMKKKRCKPTQVNSDLTPAEVNSKMADFVQAQTERELRFVMVSRALCRTISYLATAYRLHCEVEPQRRRLPVASPRLRKTAFTRLASWAEVEPILKAHHSGAGHILSFPGTHDSSVMEVSPESGGVVGRGVPVIDETNVGNRMLQGMGWRPGMGLGPDGDGIREPIHACIRPRRSGLGF